MTAPGNSAEPEARRRRCPLEPGYERELIVGRGQRRSKILEATRGDVVEGAELEERERGREDPDHEQRHRQRKGCTIGAAALIPPHRDRGGDKCAGAVT